MIPVACCLKHVFAVALFLGLRVRIPLGSRKSISCECCVLSGRDLCVGLITSLEKSYRVWRVWIWSWDLINKTAKNSQTQILIEKWLCSNSLFVCHYDCQTDNHEYSSLCTWENFYEPWILKDGGHAFFRNVRKIPATQRLILENDNRWEICNRWSARHEISEKPRMSELQRNYSANLICAYVCIVREREKERSTRCTIFFIVHFT